MQLRYNYRLDPQTRHQPGFARAFGCTRFTVNDALAFREAAHQAGQPYPGRADLSARLTAMKADPERAWLREVSVVILQQALADLDQAYRRYFASRKALRTWTAAGRKGPKPRQLGKPRFRSRKARRQAIRFTANARFKILPDGRLRLPKIGDVPVRWSRPLPSAPSSVTVIRDAVGRYFASFVVETDPVADAARYPDGEGEAGIDLGLTHFAILSDGRKIASPRFLRYAEHKLKRLQRAHSRKQKGSQNKEKSRVKVALAHAKVADSRRDFHHKTSTAIIRDNQAVYVEDLCVAGLARTRLAKSVHDAGWSAFTRMLEYKAARYGRVFARVGRWEPTSQLCSRCGTRDGPKPLDVRVWTCGACGVVHDRDVNAARNVLQLGQVAAGHAEMRNACGGQVRPAPVLAPAGETGTRPKPRRKAA